MTRQILLGCVCGLIWGTTAQSEAAGTQPSPPPRSKPSNSKSKRQINAEPSPAPTAVVPCVLFPDAAERFLFRGARFQEITVRSSPEKARTDWLDQQRIEFQRTHPFGATFPEIAAFQKKLATENRGEPDACAALDKGPYRLQDSENSNLTIDANLSAESSPAAPTNKEFRLRLSGVPSGSSEGTHTWKVLRNQTNVASIVLETVAIPQPNTIAISYADPTLRGLQSGVAAAGKDFKPSIAVVNTLWERTPNIAVRYVPAANQLNDRELRIFRAVENHVSLPDIKGIDLRSDFSYQWRITDSSHGIWFDRCVGPGRARAASKGEDPSPSPAPSVEDQDGVCVLQSISHIAFSVRTATALPLIAQLELFSVLKNRVVAEIDLQLASEARVESLPLPIADRIGVVCLEAPLTSSREIKRRVQHSSEADRHAEGSSRPAERASWEQEHPKVVARNLEVLPINDATILSGMCKAVIRAPTGEDGESVTDRVTLSGPQTLEFRVHRDKAGDDGVAIKTMDLEIASDKSRRSPWRENPGDEVFELVLPSKAADGDGPFVISVKVDASAPEAVYREGANKSSRPSDAAPATLGDRQFKTTLRPRGPFGFRDYIRMFVTVPVQIVGVRIPANPRLINSSTESTLSQFVTIRTGVLLGIEPWDYVLGKPRYPVPFRALTGFNFLTVDAQSAHFDPTYVIGFAVTLPLVDSEGRVASQVGTSLTLGPSLEIDLFSGRPYFLVNLGFNVLTLFGAK